MAANRDDIKRWLLNAEDAVGTDAAEQITWLREKRKAYAKKADNLDWEITQDSTDGASTVGRRGTSNRDEHDSIVAAISQLQGKANRAAVLGFRIDNITG